TGETLTATVDGFTTAAPGSSVTIPGDASGDIEIDSDLGGVAIGIPGDTHHSGVLVGDDDVVYDNVLTDTNIVAQATEDGAQILLTLESSAAPASFDFPVEVPEDGRLQLNADGSVSIMADLDGVDGTTETVEVGTVATPSATDAN
ncbi:MAG: hypothetical protein GY926_05115, partial [bacterium]|nr:hypothetical protein [bacterium]